MTVLDIEGHERKNAVLDWFFTHGAATALIGCAVFWSVTSTALYFIF